MTPPNILADTVKQVVKILKSPGCRFVILRHISITPKGHVKENACVREDSRDRS